MRNSTMLNLVKAYHTDFAAQYKIEDFPKLKDVCAIISIESDWNESAESSVGARGLMQITKPALDTINALYSVNLSMDDMLRADRNIWVGMRYLRWLWRVWEGNEEFERIFLTVASYNWGIGNVQHWLNEIKSRRSIMKFVPPETTDYVWLFLYYRKIWEKELKK